MDSNWLLDNIAAERDVHFRFYGVSHWLRALAMLLPPQQDIFEIYQNKNVNSLKRDTNFEETLKCVCKDLTMSLNYFESLEALNEVSEKRSILRIGIIAWYYGIYFSSKAMISATDSQCISETHTKTANLWYRLIAEKNLAIEPFNLNLSSLIKKQINDSIESNSSYMKPNNKKPRTIDEAWAQLLMNLKSTGHYYREFSENTIKREKKIERFMTRENKQSRDGVLKKKACCFLHQAYRIRGKANYRDMDYLIFFDNYTLIDEFVSDLKIVLQSFCFMAIYYCQKKLNHENFTKFLEDLTIVFPLFPKIKN